MVETVEKFMKEPNTISPALIRCYCERRQSRGEVDYNNGMILVTKKHALDRLREINVIDDAMLADGLQFYALHRQSAHDKPRCVQHHEGIDALTKLTRISRFILRWQFTLLERVCCQEFRENDFKWAFHWRSHIHDAFEALHNSFEKIKNGDRVIKVRTPQVRQEFLKNDYPS